MLTEGRKEGRKDRVNKQCIWCFWNLVKRNSDGKAFFFPNNNTKRKSFLLFLVKGTNLFFFLLGNWKRWVYLCSNTRNKYAAMKKASFCKNWPIVFKGYKKQEERMADIYWKWALYLNKRKIILLSLLVGGTVLFWAYRKSRPLSRWSIIGIEENKINLSSEISLIWEENFHFHRCTWSWHKNENMLNLNQFLWFLMFSVNY